jgi:Rrf2 family nitric oxide-sensitive transcriptional repressor
MRLNKSTRHAIRILIDCAQANGALVKVADLSARLDITPQHVFKIVHILSRADLIDAVRGRNGGVMLAHPAEEIRIGDVVRAMEATQIDGGAEGAGAARVNKVLDSALEAFVAVLDDHTLADMARGGQAQRRPAKRSA